MAEAKAFEREIAQLKGRLPPENLDAALTKAFEMIRGVRHRGPAGYPKNEAAGRSSQESNARNSSILPSTDKRIKGDT